MCIRDRAHSDDLVVLFSFYKVSREGRVILEYQKQAGYRTLAFTSRSYLPEPDRADMNLFVYRGEAKEYHSMTAPAALIDAPVVAVSEKLGDEAVQRLSLIHILACHHRRLELVDAFASLVLVRCQL